MSRITVGIPAVFPATSRTVAVVGFAEAANALADKVGVPRMKIEQDAGVLATGPRLREISRRGNGIRLRSRDYSSSITVPLSGTRANP